LCSLVGGVIILTISPSQLGKMIFDHVLIHYGWFDD
jgi:hypothetical protein